MTVLSKEKERRVREIGEIIRSIKLVWSIFFLIINNSAFKFIFFNINIVQCRSVLNYKLIVIAN